MMTTRPTEAVAQIVAVSLLLVVVLNGCATPLTVVPMHGQSVEQLARDQDECKVEVPEGSGRTIQAIGKGLRPRLYYAAVGAGVGAAVAAGATASGGTERPKDLALALGLGAGAGFVIGYIVGTVKAGETAVQAERDAAIQAFQRCMEPRGYSVWRDK
jgi:hypothetical protein